MGNVVERAESPYYRTNYLADSLRGLRGGSWGGRFLQLQPSYHAHDGSPTREFHDIGFRVASVPEPGSITLLLAGAAGLLGFTKRRRQRK